MIKVVSNQEQTATGPLPIAFNSDGTPLDDYKLYGTAEGAGIIGNNLFIGIIRDCWVNFNGEIVSRENYCVLYALIEEGKTYCFSARMGTIPTPNGYFLSKPKIGDTRSAYVDLQVDEMSGYEACYFTSTETGYVAFSQMSIGDDYAVRGMVMTEGSTPAPYDYDTNDPPYGYKLPMTVESGETENIYDDSVPLLAGILNTDGSIHGASSARNKHTYKIAVEPENAYSLRFEIAYGSALNLCWYDSENNVIASDAVPRNKNVLSTIAPDSARYVSISIYLYDQQNLTFVKSSTPPDHYIPYRYSTTTPIYIGDSKLMGEEYADYESGKIFRRADITGLSEPLCGIGTYNDSLDLSTGMLTRRIKKLVLTGEEEWVSSNGEFFFTNVNSLDFRNTAFGLLCSHLPVILRDDFNRQPSAFWGRAKRGDACLCTSDTVMSLSNFKSYLASQYAAGSPVTLWYVLDESEISTIPVPSGLTGAIDGYLIQDGTPTPETPIYPTTNGVKQMDGTYTIASVGLTPTDPPVALPELSTYQGENTLSCSEGLGDEGLITYVGPKEETIVKIMRTEDDGQGNVTEHVLYEEGS